MCCEVRFTTADEAKCIRTCIEECGETHALEMSVALKYLISLRQNSCIHTHFMSRQNAGVGFRAGLGN